MTNNTTQEILDRLVYNKHPLSVTIVELLALLGLVVWAAGYRLVKPCMFLAGFTLAFLVFYAVSPMIFRTPFCCDARGKEWAHLLISGIIGVFGGFLGFRLYGLGVFTIGECLGMIVALIVLSSPLHKYFQSNAAYGSFMACMFMVFGSLAHFFEKPIVILSTSTAGSFAFFYGLDYVLRTSFSVTIESFLLRIRDVFKDEMKTEYSSWTYRPRVPDHLSLQLTHDAFPMFIAWGVSVLIGVIVQYRITAKNGKEAQGSLWSTCCDSCYNRPRPDD